MELDYDLQLAFFCGQINIHIYYHMTIHIECKLHPLAQMTNSIHKSEQTMLNLWDKFVFMNKSMHIQTYTTN